MPQMEAMKKEGEAGRAKLNQYTRYLTVLLALVQAYALASGLEHMQGPSGSAVLNPGPFFLISTTITLTAGTVFLMWLGEQITSRGVGNGTSLIIFSSIVARVPASIMGALELSRTGALSFGAILLLTVLIIAVIALRGVRGARAAPHPRAISETPGRQQDFRRRGFAFAAEA